MAGKMILTVGMPGSGKSTWAQELKKSDPHNVLVVERDEIRSALFGEDYHKGNPDKKSEQQVSFVQDNLVMKGLQEGKTVIISDTNLNPRGVKVWVDKARQVGASAEAKHFDVDPEECKRRNTARGAAGGRGVPDFVMDRMIENGYTNGRLNDMIISEKGVWSVPQETEGMRTLEKFNKEQEAKFPEPSRSVVIVDVDGTLANNAVEADKAFGDKSKKRNYDYFFRSIKNAKVNENVVNLVNRMHDEEGLSLVVLTGRDAKYADELVSFLKRSGVKTSRVIAKREGDFRPDYEFKREAVAKLQAEGLVPVHAVDDRAQSVAIWESMGILVSKVQEHQPRSPHERQDSYPTPKVDTIYGSGKCIRCGSLLKSGGNIGPKCRLKGASA